MAERNEIKFAPDSDLPGGVPEIKEKGKLTFRDFLTVGDCDDMVRIRNEAIADGTPYGNRKIMTSEEFLPSLQKKIEEINKGGIYVVAEMDGHIVGWMSGRKSPKEENIPTAEIGDAMLGKKARGMENFKELAKTWVEKAQAEWGSKKLRAWTSTKNRARNLYKRFGFKEIEIIPSTREGIEDYAMLEKVLEDEQQVLTGAE